MTSVFLDRTARTFRIVLSLIVASAIARRMRPARSPTFQTSVNFVDVDVTVTDEAGQFVTGLTRRRLRGLRGREAANDPDLLVHRAAGRAARSISLFRAPGPCRRALEPRRILRPRLHHAPRRPERRAASHRDRAQARARVHRAALRTARSRGGGGDERPQGRGAGVHERSGAAC